MMIRTIWCCNSPGCSFCVNLNQLHENQDVVKFTQSDDYGEERLQIDSAQCDNHLWWQKFSREVLGVPVNICKNHVLGKDYCFISSLGVHSHLICVCRDCHCKLQPHSVFQGQGDIQLFLWHNAASCGYWGFVFCRCCPVFACPVFASN